MSENDPFTRVTAAFDEIATRSTEYFNVWREAMERNGTGEYAADDFLVDLQTVWGMAIRDAARVGAAWLDLLAPFAPGKDDGSS